MEQDNAIPEAKQPLEGTPIEDRLMESAEDDWTGGGDLLHLQRFCTKSFKQ